MQEIWFSRLKHSKAEGVDAEEGMAELIRHGLAATAEDHQGFGRFWRAPSSNWEA